MSHELSSASSAFRRENVFPGNGNVAGIVQDSPDAITVGTTPLTTGSAPYGSYFHAWRDATSNGAEIHGKDTIDLHTGGTIFLSAGNTIEITAGQVLINWGGASLALDAAGLVSLVTATGQGFFVNGTQIGPLGP